MPKIWNYKLGYAFLVLFCSCYARSAEAAPEEKTLTIGRIKWAVYDAATSRLLSNGVHEKTLQVSDVKITPIHGTMYRKEIELGDHFSFGLADHTGEDLPKAKLPDGREVNGDGYVLSQDHTKTPSDAKTGPSGFGLIGNRDDMDTFSWDWFVVDRSGHATKLQESGELSFDTKKTPNGLEINHMRFLTDVSIRIVRRDNQCSVDPTWRIKIFKDSDITWPVLVDGVVQR